MTKGSLETHLTTAEQAEAQDRFVDALRGYRDALLIDPHHADALLGAGRMCHVLGYVDRALEHFTRLLVVVRDDPRAWCARGRVFLELDRLGQARADLDTALALDASDGDVLHARAQLWNALGRPDDALSELRVALEDAPADPDLHLERIRALIVGDTHDLLANTEHLEALAHSRQVIAGAFGEDDAWTLLTTAVLAALDDDRHRAVPALRDALDAEPELIAEIAAIPVLEALLEL